MSTKKQVPTSTVGTILFWITTFYASAVVGAFASTGTSLLFDIFTSTPLMSGITAGLLTLAALISSFIIIRKSKFTPQPLMGLGIIVGLAVTYGMATYVGSTTTMTNPLTIEKTSAAADAFGMGVDIVWPLIPFIIAVMFVFPAIRMIDPNALK